MDIQKQVAFEKFNAKECNCDYEELKRAIDHYEALTGHRYPPTSPRHEAWLVWCAAWEAKAHAATYEPCSIKAHEIIINETKNELIDGYDIAKEDEYLLESLVYRGSCIGKNHAVPEGFVLVSEDQAKDTERLNFLICGNSIRTVVQRDIENDDYEKIGEHYLFTELYWIDGWDYHENTSSDTERGAIDKAMIEAQESKND